MFPNCGHFYCCLTGAAAELDLEKDLPENLPAAMRQRIITALASVRREGRKLADLLALKPPKLKEAKALQSPNGALGKALKQLQVALVGAPCKRLLAACFAAGTQLLTPEGSKAIEEFRVGDLVLSRNEADPDGAVEAKVVEEVFVRLGVVWHLHVGGEVIRTTAEHPFWVEGQGWTPAWLLVAGDVLLGHDGRRMPVEEVFDTGEWDTVYNLRVADFHTYFVGSQEWAFSVWAHNAYFVHVEVNGKWYVRVQGGRKYIPKTGQNLADATSGARVFSNAQEAEAFAMRVNAERKDLEDGLAGRQGFTEKVIDGLFRSNNGYVEPVDRDGIFFDLVSARSRQTTAEGHRPRLTWDEAVEVFTAADWTPPTRPAVDFTDLNPLRPANMPPPVLPVGQRFAHNNGVPYDMRHLLGAYHEQLLAFEVHGGRIGPAEIVVYWGDKSNSHGADMISVNPTTGQVTLWDAKYRTAPGSPFPSSTFTDTLQAERARDHALDILRTNTTLSSELKALARQSLLSSQYLQKTVRYSVNRVRQGAPVETPPPPRQS